MYRNKLIELNDKLFNIAKNNKESKILPYHNIGLFCIPFCVILIAILYHYFHQDVEYYKYYFFYIFSAISFFAKIEFDSFIKKMTIEDYNDISFGTVDPTFIYENKTIFDFFTFIASLIRSICLLLGMSFILMLPSLVVIGIPTGSNFLFEGKVALPYLLILFSFSLFYLKHNIGRIKNIKCNFIQQDKFKQIIDNDIKTIMSEFENENHIFNTYILLNDAKKENLKYLTYELNKRLNSLLLKNNYEDINDYLIKQNENKIKQNNSMINT